MVVCAVISNDSDDLECTPPNDGETARATMRRKFFGNHPSVLPITEALIEDFTNTFRSLNALSVTPTRIPLAPTASPLTIDDDYELDATDQPDHIYPRPTLFAPEKAKWTTRYLR